MVERPIHPSNTPGVPPEVKMLLRDVFVPSLTELFPLKQTKPVIQGNIVFGVPKQHCTLSFEVLYPIKDYGLIYRLRRLIENGWRY
jgi:hypothetical protein